MILESVSMKYRVEYVDENSIAFLWYHIRERNRVVCRYFLGTQSMDFPHFFFASRDNHPSSYIRQDSIKQSHDTVCMYLFFLYINHIHVQEARDVYQFYLIRSYTEDLLQEADKNKRYQYTAVDS